MFFAWVADKPKPRVLLMDNHGSHFDFATFHEALDNDIHIVGSPPNATHLYQPLDVGCFKDLRIDWRTVLRVFFRANRLAKITKAVFPQLLKELWLRLRPSYLAAGFRGAGLCPFNPNQIARHKFLPSITVTKVPTIPQQDSPTAAHGGPSTSAAPTFTVAASSLDGRPAIAIRIQKTTPKTAMRLSIEKCVLGPQQVATAKAPKKRSKVQNFYGQVHTEETALRALEEREKSRKQMKTDAAKRPTKKSSKVRKKKARKSSPAPTTAQNEDEDEDRVENKCFICFSDKDPPTKCRRIDWNRCLPCGRWYHEWCQKKKGTFCPFCPAK